MKMKRDRPGYPYYTRADEERGYQALWRYPGEKAWRRGKGPKGKKVERTIRMESEASQIHGCLNTRNGAMQ